LSSCAIRPRTTHRSEGITRSQQSGSNQFPGGSPSDPESIEAPPGHADSRAHGAGGPTLSLPEQDTFLRMYMLYGDKADFLRQPFTAAWQQRFADLDLIISDMAAKVRVAGVPLIVIPVPSRAQAALLSSQQRPPHVDPFAFGFQIETIASNHGAAYVDLMEPLSSIPPSEDLFYVVDGHVTAAGQGVIARHLSQKLLDGSVSALSPSRPPPRASREH